MVNEKEDMTGVEGTFVGRAHGGGGGRGRGGRGGGRRRGGRGGGGVVAVGPGYVYDGPVEIVDDDDDAPVAIVRKL